MESILYLFHVIPLARKCTSSASHQCWGSGCISSRAAACCFLPRREQSVARGSALPLLIPCLPVWHIAALFAASPKVRRYRCIPAPAAEMRGVSLTPGAIWLGFVVVAVHRGAALFHSSFAPERDSVGCYRTPSFFTCPF